MQKIVFYLTFVLFLSACMAQETVSTTISPTATLPISTFNLQNTTTDAIALNPDTLNLQRVLWTNDGEQIIAVGEQAILVYDTDLALDYGWLVSGVNVSSMALSDDGTRLAVGQENGFLRMWRVGDGVELGTLNIGEQPVTQLQFLERERVVAQSGTSISVFELENTGLTAIRPASPYEMPIAYSGESALHPDDNKKRVRIADTNMLILETRSDSDWQMIAQDLPTELPAQENLNLIPSNLLGGGCSTESDTCDN